MLTLDKAARKRILTGLAAVLGTLLSRDATTEQEYSELNVRANTGLGAV